jgi:hypothetical protein
MTTEEIKTSAPINGVALVQNPELIRVQTISKKLVEQLQFIDGEAGSKLGRTDFDGCQFIGSVDYCPLVRDEQGKLWRLRGIAFIMWQQEKHGATNAEANERLRALPQILTS